MYDEQELLGASPLSLEPAQVVQLVRGPKAATWLDRLGFGERARVADVLKRALVDNELAGNYTTPDLLAAFTRLGGTEDELDTAVLSEGALRRDTGGVSPAGTAVVWSRLVRVQESLSEGEVRAWLCDDMVRALASKSATWTRFSAIVLGDWARKEAANTTENSLAKYLIEKHPSEAAAVLAQAMREDPAGASLLADRIEAGSPKTLAVLVAATVDDASLPAGLRVMLAGRSSEQVRARARDMVARELGVSKEALARLSPETEDEAPQRSDDGPTPEAQRLAWIVAGSVLLITGVVPFGFRFSFILAMLAFTFAWFVARDQESPDE